MGAPRPFRATATGQMYANKGAGVLAFVRLTAGAAAAAATVREVDGSGTILAELAAPANGSDIAGPIVFSEAVHLSAISGAGAIVMAYVE